MIRSMLLGAASLAVLMPVGYASAASETVLYSFESVEAGAYPESGLVADGTGAFYGTTSQGGAERYTTGAGTVFKIIPPAPGQTSWTENLVINLDETHGKTPFGGLVMGTDGALYGTTYGETVARGAGTHGAVIKLTPAPAGQSGRTETALHMFLGGLDGANPQATMPLGADGALYGTTFAGGGTGGIDSTGGGTVFKLTPPAVGHPTWTETVLHRFTGGTDGSNPLGTLVADSSGALYGTTTGGGGSGCGGNGCGTVFRLTPLNAGKTSWHETILYRFRGTNGAGPQGGLLRRAGGVFYGTTAGGGSANAGTVFRLTPPAVGKISWSLSVLHAFTGANGDGAFPTAGLVADAKGMLYGTTYIGGDKGLGTVFQVAP